MNAWLLLIVSLPPTPSSLRVRTWRKLRALGAVPLKRSVYVLPATSDHYEQFQWLTQEAQRAGGDATLLQVERIENVSEADVIRLFQDARDRDYRGLGERYRRLLRGVERTTGRRPSPRRDEELRRLAKELDGVRRIDFFDAAGYQEAKRLQETIEMRLHPPVPAASTPSPPALPLDTLRGRRWVTRPRPHVDRLGSAWLIKRFIDPGAEFVFAPPEAFPDDAIPFDALGAEFGHQGEDCTFETLLKRAGLRDARLAGLAEIVHEVDLRDRKFHREEGEGLDLALRGLLAAVKDDHEVLAYGMTLFDGLYGAIGEKP